jgi:coenzyme F420-reducing hydrogenase beta subunit
VDKKEDLPKLQKSKYVQSSLKGIFRPIKKLLDEGKCVLFSGTPCQVTGIKSFLRKDYPNLFLCEVLCYGVPSPLVYEKYLSYLEEKNASHITNINFKDKRYGWDYYTTNITFLNGKQICKFGGDSYRAFMAKKWSLRPSCLNCLYGINRSEADISLGDFYNYERYISTKPPKDGVSCVLLRTKKGKQLFSTVEHELVCEKVTSDVYMKQEEKINNGCCVDERELFYRILNTQGYNSCLSLLPKEKVIMSLRRWGLSLRRRWLK